MSSSSDPLLRANRVSKYFHLRGGLFPGKVVRAVDGVTFDIAAGESLVLMGESGCGKTTCALTVMRLIEPTAGEVVFRGRELFSLQAKELRAVRRSMQIVLQDPLSSLDPRVSARQAILEPLRIYQRQLRLSKRDMEERVSHLAEMVGLREEELDRYPRELSGGQQQRVCICRALILQPELLVLDEPTSALDVSVQARVLNLIIDLRTKLNLTYLFVTHNAAVARYIGDRIGIMYLGKIVEVGDAQAVLDGPLHPYTRVLLASVLSPVESVEEKHLTLRGSPERPVDLPVGCVFQRRCDWANTECREGMPELAEARPGHWVRCYRVPQNAPPVVVEGHGASGQRTGRRDYGEDPT